MSVGRASLSGDSGFLEVLTSGGPCRVLSGGPRVRELAGNPGRETAHLGAPPFPPLHPPRFAHGTIQGTTCGCRPKLCLSSEARPQGRGGDAGAGWAVPHGNPAGPCALRCQLGSLCLAFPRAPGR